MASTYTRKHGLRAWEGSNGVGKKGIVEGGKVPMLICSARMRRAHGTDFVSARCDA